MTQEKKTKKKKDNTFNPVKEQVGNQSAQAVVWSTKSINLALDAIKKGLPLKASPFNQNNTNLLKPELVYQRTKEEVEDYIHCMQDVKYFATKCHLMTPEGLKLVELRDYQLEYLDHLNSSRFSIFLSCRQSGKCFSFFSEIILFSTTQLEKLSYYQIKDNTYKVPFFEFFNLFCKKTWGWILKYKIYKLIYKIENNYGRKKRNED